MSFTAPSLRARAVGLVLVAVVPAFALLVIAARREQHRIVEGVRAEAYAATRTAALQYRDVVESSRQILVALARMPELRQPDPARCHDVLADLLAHYDTYTNLGIADLAGDVTCSGLPLAAPVNIADRSEVQRAVRSNGPAVGEYRIGRITRRPGINVAQAVHDDSGRVAGVVFVAIDLRRLGEIASSQSLPTGDSVTVLDRRGTILARSPGGETWTVKTLPDAPVVRTILAQGEGTAELTGIDGITRLYAFTSIGNPRDPDLHVAVGVPVEHALAPAARFWRTSLALTGLLAVLAVATAWLASGTLLVAPVGALVAAARRVTGAISALARDCRTQRTSWASSPGPSTT